MTVVQEFCKKKKASRKVEDAFVAYCRSLVREYYNIYNGETTTGLVMRFTDDDLERVWQEFKSELGSLE